MWTSTSKVIQSNEIQKENIQLDLDFPNSITTSSATCFRGRLCNEMGRELLEGKKVLTPFFFLKKRLKKDKKILQDITMRVQYGRPIAAGRWSTGPADNQDNLT
jgi:hypothetical protein